MKKKLKNSKKRLLVRIANGDNRSQKRFLKLIEYRVGRKERLSKKKPTTVMSPNPYKDNLFELTPLELNRLGVSLENAGY